MDRFRGKDSGKFPEFPLPSRCDHSTLPCESLQLCRRHRVSSLFLVLLASPCEALVPRYMLPHRSWSSRSCSRDDRIRTPESYAALPASHIDSRRCFYFRSQFPSSHLGVSHFLPPVPG